ncbi:hypothetical protein EDF38_1280 [Frigoribacterium sp. PhB160]|uniref:hypothetical protein n=1 Tax=Frigoribacterium sp. PhB160 TaxID=2485192 RepID=UPI000FC08E02|nr:hypothetical protein [Frigoribacterium sp. PhB160]ROS62177.1 hypothetical protein EDF38_1280 [Frigoribacterium sp. PhB160]
MSARSKLNSAINNAGNARNVSRSQDIQYLAAAIADLAGALKDLEENGTLKATSD